MENFIVYSDNVDENVLKELNIFVSKNAVVQNGARLYFNCCIIGDSVIYSTAVVHSNSSIINSVIANDCVVYSSRVEDSELNSGCVVGPFAHIKDCVFGANCKVGNFSVVKSASLAGNVMISSLAMLENCEIGQNSVMGAGVIFSTNDEEKILIGDKVKIGANSSIIGQIEIADEAVVAVGGVITRNVGYRELASTKPKQVNMSLKD